MRGDTHASLFDLCSVGVSSLLFVKQTPCSSFLPGATSATKSLTRDFYYRPSLFSEIWHLTHSVAQNTVRLNKINEHVTMERHKRATEGQNVSP